ncbi:MAG: RNA 2',3'-cyclic phosphodiesterase [Nanoarchaeota archaeon]
MKRLFIGVPLSEEVKRAFSLLLEKLKATEADLKLVAPDNLHFTVKFLGEVEEQKIGEVQEKLREVLKSLKPFSLQLQGIGAFPGRERINSIWVAAASREFVVLMKNVDQALDFICQENHGEEVPHATLARVKTGKNKERLQQLLEEFKPTDFGTMRVDKVVLYESELGKEGPVYKVVGEFEVGK